MMFSCSPSSSEDECKRCHGYRKGISDASDKYDQHHRRHAAGAADYL